MRSKKKEKSLLKDLDAIKQLKNESFDLKDLEDKMSNLILRAS
jgi:hypothetical protein